MSNEQEMNPEQAAPYVKPKKPEDYYGTFDTSIIYEYKTNQIYALDVATITVQPISRVRLAAVNMLANAVSTE